MDIIDRILPYVAIIPIIIIISGFLLGIYALFFKPKTFVPTLKPVHKIKLLPIFYFPIYLIYLLIYRSKPKTDKDLEKFIILTRNIAIIIFLAMLIYFFIF